MLSYAFYALNDDKYKKVETEEFENTADLFSEILAIGVAKQIKQGLVKDYIDVKRLLHQLEEKLKSLIQLTHKVS